MADTAPNADSQPAPAAGGGTTAQLSIEKIYVKDLSLENPGAPQSFQVTDAPQIEIGLRTRGEQVAPDVYECVLTLTVTARAGDKTVFLVEAAQAGVFTIRGIAAQPAAGGARDPLPDGAVPVRAGNHRGCDDASRLSARATRPDQF